MFLINENVLKFQVSLSFLQGVYAGYTPVPIELPGGDGIHVWGGGRACIFYI